jgi:hypothetical protein
VASSSGGPIVHARRPMDGWLDRRSVALSAGWNSFPGRDKPHPVAATCRGRSRKVATADDAKPEHAESSCLPSIAM